MKACCRVGVHKKNKNDVSQLRWIFQKCYEDGYNFQATVKSKLEFISRIFINELIKVYDLINFGKTFRFISGVKKTRMFFKLLIITQWVFILK